MKPASDTSMLNSHLLFCFAGSGCSPCGQNIALCLKPGISPQQKISPEVDQELSDLLMFSHQSEHWRLQHHFLSRLSESWSRARLSYNTVWERYRPFWRIEPSSISEIDFLAPHFFFTQPTTVLSLPKLQFKAEYTLNWPEYAFCFPLSGLCKFLLTFQETDEEFDVGHQM